MSLPQVTIIGGGISGLTCGWHLSQAGYQVKILEKEGVLGGLARSFFMNGTWIPLACHHLMLPDKQTREYIKIFDFLKDLRWIKSPKAFWYEGRPYLLGQPQGLFGFPALGLRSKLSLFKLGLSVWLKKNWEDLKETSCEEWLNSVLDNKTSELLFRNPVDSKFNLPLSNISAAWLGSAMHRDIRDSDRYGYIKPGWQALFSKMANEIIEQGGEVLSNFEVRSICDGKIIGIDKDAQERILSYEIVVSTVPAPILNRLCAHSHPFGDTLEKIKYKALISFVCASCDRISPYYRSLVLKPHLVFGSFLNFSILSAWATGYGENIYYFSTYLENDDSLLGYPQEQLKELYLNDIRKIFPHFYINWFKIFKLAFSQPVFLRDYQNPPIELTDNLYLAGVYRQFPQPRTMETAFYSGQETAEYIINKYAR